MIKYRNHVLLTALVLDVLTICTGSRVCMWISLSAGLASIICSTKWILNQRKGSAVFNQMAASTQKEQYPAFEFTRH